MAGSNPDPDSANERTLRFLHHCRRRLDAVAGDGPARDGAAALTAALDAATPRAFEPSRVPVLDSIDRLTGLRPADPLVDDFVALAPHLPWIPTHRATDGGTELALAPLDRVLDVGETVIGIMYVGPDATYPLHRHPPQELYLTIAGDGRWRYGGHDHFEDVGPGRTLYNHPDDLHSAIAGPVPVVALYVLW